MARSHTREASLPGEEGFAPLLPGEVNEEHSMPCSRQEIRTSDREELMQCIKRGERPTWVPKPNLEALCAEAYAQAQGVSSKEPVLPRQQDSAMESHNDHAQPQLATPPRDPVDRTPSALHSGDFYEQPLGASPDMQTDRQLPQSKAISFGPPCSRSPPWLSNVPHSRYLRRPSDSAASAASTFTVQRSRAPSLGSSLSSSFVMRTPTSPLVQATSSPSLDACDDGAGQPSHEGRTLRRRTLPPHSFGSANLPQADSATSISVPASRREATAPNRTHQVRRSLTSFTYQPAPSAQGVYSSRQRRLSHASETSPRSRQSMVGSFEESILRGRMSTPPSKPLDFVAQIGVLGKGSCPAKLKCPAHVSVPFPAVFYNYPSTSTSRSISDDSPSPYVGTIDLEHHLKPVEEPQRRTKRAEVHDPDAIMAQITGPQSTSIGRALAQQEASKVQQSHEAPKILLDGAYRVPQNGQLQVVIKNPNKTAVKLFLISYDLDGMSPGTKTFVRQRSFSSGSIMENILSEAPVSDPLSEKQLLRYLIHLKFCCLSKGKFYLYDNIRIVFANRVPEGKEKLRNEVQLPEPKYSSFAAGVRSRRQSVTSSPTSSPLSISETYRSVIELVPGHSARGADASFSPVPIPFYVGRRLPQATVPERMPTSVANGQPDTVNDGQEDSEDDICKPSARPQSPEVHGFDRISTSQRGSPVPWNATVELAGRRSPSPALVTGDGLLSRKLREIGKQYRPSSSLERDQAAAGQEERVGSSQNT